MDSQAQSVGQGGVGVQTSGDHNTITVIVGGSKLVCNQLHKNKAEPTNIIELLRAELRTTTLVGREAECRMLADWLAAPASISVKCLIGGAGAGKTRLAIEACEAAEDAGWWAAFAPSAELKRFHDSQNLANWAEPRNALIVIDYAATSLGVLKGWFTALAATRDRGVERKLRILLLERYADAEAGWWAELAGRDSLDRACP